MFWIVAVEISGRTGGRVFWGVALAGVVLVVGLGTLVTSGMLTLNRVAQAFYSVALRTPLCP